MSAFAIKSDELVLPSGVDGFGYLIIEDGKFSGVTVEEPAGMRIVDRVGCWVAPGFVDTHIHGFGGCDVMDADPKAIHTISTELARRGTTSWLPTTLTADAQDTGQACAAVAACAQEQASADAPVGARVQGIFLEGPFFTEGHKGAQNPAYLCDPSMALLQAWQEQAHGLVRKSALAPERDGALAYVAAASAAGVTVCIGHSSASYGQAAAAVLAGAHIVVHTFNGMDELGHRDPGIVGCAMTSQGVYAELICDGQHVDPIACEALVRAKGWEHVVLITDCLSCGGLPDGKYSMGGLDIELTGGAAHLVEGGNLAGSTLTMAQAACNVMHWGIVTAEQAIRMATEVPARSCGIIDRCGAILPGRDADLVVLDPTLQVVETYVGGRLVEKA